MRMRRENAMGGPSWRRCCARRAPPEPPAALDGGRPFASRGRKWRCLPMAKGGGWNFVS